MAHDPNVADATGARPVLTIPHHEFPNHNGGQLQFGPGGDLYVGVGDGGSEGDPQGNGQNPDVLLGKLLRISPKPGGGYSIPPGNPFARQAGKRPMVWAYGLRNPWRFSFDRLTGDLTIGDVGQDLEEEIDFAPRGTGIGANYGWSVFEGRRRNQPGSAPKAVWPVLVKLHRLERRGVVVVWPGPTGTDLRRVAGRPRISRHRSVMGRSRCRVF